MSSRTEFAPECCNPDCRRPLFSSRSVLRGECGRCTRERNPAAVLHGIINGRLGGRHRKKVVV